MDPPRPGRSAHDHRDRHRARPHGNIVGERVELGRYRVRAGERVVYGQRVNGVVRVTDVPLGSRGRAYLIEREFEQDGFAALRALVADYLQQARRLGSPPMALSSLQRYLEYLA